MELADYVALVLIGAVVFVPLGREYADFRRSWGLTRRSAAATTLLFLPALAFGLAASARLADSFGAQWATAVVVALVAYSAATAAVRVLTAALEPACSPRRSG